MPYVFQNWCRAVKILVSSSFFEQMTFEQMTHLQKNVSNAKKWKNEENKLSCWRNITLTLFCVKMKMAILLSFWRKKRKRFGTKKKFWWKDVFGDKPITILCQLTLYFMFKINKCLICLSTSCSCWANLNND